MNSETGLYKWQVKQLQAIAADLVTNGDFAEYDSACLAMHSSAQPCPDPFNSGCINTWKASHGSPEFSILEQEAILGSVKTNGYQWGEGIFQILDQTVDSGETYLLLFDYKGEGSCIDNTFMSVQLTNFVFHAGTCFEMLPNPGWEIPGGPFHVKNEVKSSRLVFKAMNTFSKIWFCPVNESDTVTWIKIRNIHLFNLNDISPSLRPQLFLSEGSYNGKQTPLLITNPSQAVETLMEQKENPASDVK